MPNVVTFDPLNLRIVEISTGTDNELDWIEIYSEWKQWLLDDASRLGYPPAFRVVGGDPISNIENLGSTFFLLFPWKFRPAEHNHRLTLNGNIFTDPAGESPIVPTLGNFQVVTQLRVSTLVEATVARLDLLQLQDGVYIDTISGADTNDGTNTAPVQTLSRAFTIANTNGLSTFFLRGAVALDRNTLDWKFVGASEATASVDFNGYTVTGSHFEECTLQGAATGAIIATECRIGAATGLDGVFRRCGFSASVATAAGAQITAVNCFCMNSGVGSRIFTVGAGSLLGVHGWMGSIELQGVTAGSIVSIELHPGRLVLHSSCTGGTVLVRGLSQIENNATGTTVVDAGLVEAELVNKAATAAALAAG